MAKFIIQPHGRLNDWVAHEKGYFVEEGLDYELNVEGSRKNTPQLAGVDVPMPLEDNRFGAFERYAEGHGRKGEGAGDVSCACHWTVNQAAKVEEGVMWGKAYSVCEAAIVVPGDSSVAGPGDLAHTDVAVGYHSGSHYSALQALEVFLAPEDIALKFVGSSWSRVDAALARKIPAVNVWGPQLYLLEQHRFRRIVSTTFMMAFMFHRDVESANVERYMRALIRAQADIDVEPERYKHYFINEIPDRFRDKVDVRRFGVGERVVAQPYTRAMFEKTQAWMHARKLFEAAPDAGVSYEQAVDR
jgi:ABC-type nitrate/sulfonate/bicarbonate transport system substrate-binding protein